MQLSTKMSLKMPTRASAGRNHLPARFFGSQTRNCRIAKTIKVQALDRDEIKQSPLDAPGGGGGGSNFNGGNGGGGDGDGASSNGGSNDKAAILALLLAAGKSIEQLPADMAKAFASGKLSTEILRRYLALESVPWLRPALALGGFRERLLADANFFTKLGFETFIGVATKLAAERERRGASFQTEIDFVFANVIMAIIADFMLVYVPAPTVSFAMQARRVGWWRTSALGKFFDACPGNAFQKVPPGSDAFTLTQRCGAILKKGATLFGVGFVSSLIGVCFANTIIFARTWLDPTFVPANRPQNVAFTSMAYGTYMAHNSNLRYQFVAGVIENRFLERVFANNAMMYTLSSFFVRTLNTFLGSLMWVDFTRTIGMQKSKFTLEEEQKKKGGSVNGKGGKGVASKSDKKDKKKK